MSWLLIRVSVDEPRVRPGVWLKWSALVVVCAGVVGRHPGFARSSPGVAVGWGRGAGDGEGLGRRIGLFVNCCPEFAQLRMHSYF